LETPPPIPHPQRGRLRGRSTAQTKTQPLKKLASWAGVYL
jgi:hypothetical protein